MNINMRISCIGLSEVRSLLAGLECKMTSFSQGHLLLLCFGCSQGWNCRGFGVEPLRSCLQTLIFERKSALNFNPWAAGQNFKHFDIWSPYFF